MRPTPSLLAAALALTLALPAQAVSVYSNDFDNPAVVAPGVVASFGGVGGLQGTIAPYAATFGNIWRSDSNTTAVTLSLSNLPAHTAISVGFVMAFLDSWDSTDGNPAPDLLDVAIDGNPFGRYTYNNASGSSIFVGGGTVLAQYVQFDAAQFFSDTVVDMSADPAYTFAHTASTLTVTWIAAGSGWQGGADESFGLDNVNVSLTVPEPGTWAMLGAGLLAVGGMAGRRRSAG